MAYFLQSGGSEIELTMATNPGELKLPKFENHFTQGQKDTTIPYRVSRKPKKMVNEKKESRLAAARQEAERLQTAYLNSPRKSESPGKAVVEKARAAGLSRLLHHPASANGAPKQESPSRPKPTRPRWTTSQVDKPLSPRVPGDVLPPTDKGAMKANATPSPRHRAVTAVRTLNTLAPAPGAPPAVPSTAAHAIASEADIQRLKEIAQREPGTEQDTTDQPSPPALTEPFWNMRDISFLGDTAPGSEKGQLRGSLPLEVGTMIPPHHQVVEEFPVRPDMDLTMSDAVYDEHEHKWLKQVFPLPSSSIKPAGRKDAAILLTWLEEMTARCRRGDAEEAQERADLRTVCQVGFNELVRQVNSRCSEHGVMMVKLWTLIIENFDKNKPLKIEEQRIKELNAQRKALEEEIAGLQDRVHSYQEQVTRYEGFVQEVSNIHADKMTELSNVYKELEEEKSHVSEIHNVVRSRDEDIRKLKHRVVTHEQTMLDLRNHLGDIGNTCEDIVEFNSRFNRPTRGLADRNIRTTLSDDPEIESKRHVSSVRVVQEFVSEGMRMREIMYEKLGRSLERDDGVRAGHLDVRDALVQTDPFYIRDESDNEPEEEEPVEDAPAPEPEKKKKKKRARKLNQFLHFPAALQPFLAGVKGKGRIKSLRWVTRNILQIYSEKIFMDHACDREGRTRLAFPDFVYDFHQTKFGLKDLADQNMLDFCESIALYKKYDECYGVKTFWRMLDGVDVNDLRHLNFYLSVFEELRNSNSGRAGLSVIHATEGGQRFIATHKLMPVARGTVSTFSSDLQARFLRKVNELQVGPPPGFPDFFLRGSNQSVVDVDAFFFHLMHSYAQELGKRDRTMNTTPAASRDPSMLDLRSDGASPAITPIPDDPLSPEVSTRSLVRHNYELSKSGTHVKGKSKRSSVRQKNNRQTSLGQVRIVRNESSAMFVSDDGPIPPTSGGEAGVVLKPSIPEEGDASEEPRPVRQMSSERPRPLTIELSPAPRRQVDPALLSPHTNRVAALALGRPSSNMSVGFPSIDDGASLNEGDGRFIDIGAPVPPISPPQLSPDMIPHIPKGAKGPSEEPVQGGEGAEKKVDAKVEEQRPRADSTPRRVQVETNVQSLSLDALAEHNANSRPNDVMYGNPVYQLKR